jgi:copper(I)-binding protein
MIKVILSASVLLLFASRVCAGDVSVSQAWVRASAPGQETAAVTLHIISQKDGRLVAASSPASTGAEFHSMKIDDGMMRMRQVQAVSLPAKRQVDLGSGDHIMLVGLKGPLKSGESIPLTLTVEFADKSTENVQVKVEVRPQGETHDMHGM